MAKGNKSKSAKTTNQKKHKENLSKELRKKRIQKQKENEKQYAYNGGGPRVVSRTRRDVSAAPAMKGEKIKKGYVSTYPVVETNSGKGFFDQTQMLNEYLARSEKGLTFDNFMRNLSTKMSPEQMQELMTTNKELVEMGARNQQLARINAEKNKVHELKKENERLLAQIGIEEMDANNPDFLNQEEANYMQLEESYKKKGNKYKAIKSKHDSAMNAREETELIRKQAENSRSAHIAYLRNQKRGKSEQEKQAIDKHIEDLKNLALDDSAGLETQLSSFFLQAKRFKNTEEQYHRISKVMEDAQKDHNQLALVFEQMTAFGFEDARSVELIERIKTKIAKNVSIHGDMQNLVNHYELLSKQLKEENERLVKNGKPIKAAVDKLKKEQYEGNERMKQIMLDSDFYDASIKDKILHNDYKQNFERFKHFVAGQKQRHIAIQAEANTLFHELMEMEGDRKYDDRAIQQFNKTWETLKEYWGEDAVEKSRKEWNEYLAMTCAAKSSDSERNYHDDISPDDGYNEYEADEEENRHEKIKYYSQGTSYGGINYDEHSRVLFGETD